MTSHVEQIGQPSPLENGHDSFEGFPSIPHPLCGIPLSFSSPCRVCLFHFSDRFE